MQNLNALPSGLPVPQDDGACQHLAHKALPDLHLSATDNSQVNLAQIKNWLVLYCYPMTGLPNKSLPNGWDEIPGARGCTPQACAFRDHHQTFQQLGVTVFGLSTQTSSYQQEAAARLHLPFLLLSDAGHQLIDALKLPTFTVDGMRLNKRVTLIAYNGVIAHYFYPVFPPDQHAEQLLSWFTQHA